MSHGLSPMRKESERLIVEGSAPWPRTFSIRTKRSAPQDLGIYGLSVEDLHDLRHMLGRMIDLVEREEAVEAL